MSAPQQPVPNIVAGAGGHYTPSGNTASVVQHVLVDQLPDAHPAILSEMDFKVLKDGAPRRPAAHPQNSRESFAPVVEKCASSL